MANVVLPIVRLFFPCEGAIFDLEEEKWTLINPLHTLEMLPSADAHLNLPGVALYAQFTGGVGSFNLSVHLVDDSGFVLGKSRPPTAWNMAGGDEIYEDVFVMPPVRLAHPGVYQFVLIANHAAVPNGTAWLRVLSGG